MRNIRVHFSNLRCATILCDSCYYSASLTTFSMATCSETQFYPNVLRNTIGLLLGLFFLFVPFTDTLQAQEDIQISSPDDVVVICDGFFYDDGALGAVDGGPYTDQDYSITICPETAGDAIQVVFLAFDLQTNANPNNNDVLYVFDGDDSSAEMVGAGTNNSLLGVSFTASTFNPTGCLTFVFNSNNPR